MPFSLLVGAGPSHQARHVAKLSRGGWPLLVTGSYPPAIPLRPFGLRSGFDRIPQ